MATIEQLRCQAVVSVLEQLFFFLQTTAAVAALLPCSIFSFSGIVIIATKPCSCDHG